MSEMKLRECPFCGCTDVSNKDDGHTEWFECDWCGATSGYDPAPEFEGKGAAWHWNRRSPDPRLAMAREALEKTRADFEAWAKIRGGIGTYQGAIDRIDATLKALEEG